MCMCTRRLSCVMVKLASSVIVVCIYKQIDAAVDIESGAV